MIANPILVRNMRVGDAFTFTPGGPVYVRSKGGFRPGRGGELVKFSRDQKVYLYTGLSA